MDELTNAVVQGNIPRVEELVKNGANINKIDEKERTPLIYAAIDGNREMFDKLIELGADVNLGNPLIHILLMEDGEEEEKMEWFIEKGANVNQQNENGETPLIHATMLSNQRAIDFLIENDADVNIRDTANESTALEWALSNSDTPIDVVKTLCEVGADLNAKNPDGRTPLFLTVDNTINLEALKTLVEWGAKVNIPNDDGETVLHYASKYEGDELQTAIEAIGFLLEKGADINAQDSNGDTPLIASVNDDVTILTFLLKKGASPNLQDKNGDTALMMAAFEGYQAAVRTLLEYGPNVNIRDNRGRSAIDKAFTPKIRRMLEEASTLSSTDKWKGYTKTDAEFFNTILADEKNLNDISMCPFCLQYTERVDACKYMTHICKAALRHERLYNLYKNSKGEVVWCTVCGRHCIGHGHFPLTDTRETQRPPVMIAQPGANVYKNESCPLEGGGGPNEKIRRIDGMLRYLCEVQDEVDKRLDKDVRTEVIEEAWKAASSRAPKTERTASASKKFNIPCELPSIAAASTETVYPDLPNPNPLPVKTENDTCSVTLDDCEVYEFQHIQPDGTTLKHEKVGKVAIRDIVKNAQGDVCPIDPSCKGKLHPDEIKAVFGDEETELYTNYKRRYNEYNKVGGRTRKSRKSRKTRKNRKFRGGNPEGTPIISKMAEASCSLPVKKKKGGNTRKSSIRVSRR